uniref:FRG1-like family protein n=1 Tax=Parastrongyloides trichosuri TaxID=131310 RepID=A0A0N4Z954_PARTI
MSSSDYTKIKKGGFKLKGKVSVGIDKKKKKVVKKVKEIDYDAEGRGGWRRLTSETDLRGGIDIALECGNYGKQYLLSQNNGKFVIGPIHENNTPPDPEEVFTIIKAPDDTAFSLKTGYGRYIGVNKDDELVATAEAISERERFEVVTEGGKTAVQNVGSGKFLTLNQHSNKVVSCSNNKAEEFEMINIRTNVLPMEEFDAKPAEDLLASGDCETSYTKMFQHSKVNIKNKHICVDVNNKKDIRKAKDEGTLHATLLDRRMKMKSDRYC